jgi:hypothetical protein
MYNEGTFIGAYCVKDGEFKETDKSKAHLAQIKQNQATETATDFVEEIPF